MTSTTHDGVYRASSELRTYERRKDLDAADGVDANPADISDSAQGLAARAQVAAQQAALNDSRQAEAPAAVASRIPKGDFKPLGEDLADVARREVRAGRIRPESATYLIEHLESGDNDARAAAAHAVATAGSEARKAGNTKPLGAGDFLAAALTGKLRDPGNEHLQAQIREDARKLAEATRSQGGETALALDALGGA